MAKPYVSFDEVKTRVPIERLLAHYGLLDARIKRKGDELTLHCVFHDNDTTPSLKVNTVKNIFNCFGCNQGGDVIGFVVLKEGIETGAPDTDRREAALLLQEWFALATRQPGKARGRSTKPTRGTSRAAASTTSPKAGVPETLAREDEEARQYEPAKDRENTAVVNPPLQFTFQHLDSTHAYLITDRALTSETIATFGIGYQPMVLVSDKPMTL